MTAGAERLRIDRDHVGPQRLSLDEIRRHRWTEVFNDVFHRDIHIMGTTTSTNDVSRRLAEEGAPEGTVVIAEEQIQARGRRGARGRTGRMA